MLCKVTIPFCGVTKHPQRTLPQKKLTSHIVIPAKAGIYVGYGHRPEPVLGPRVKRGPVGRCDKRMESGILWKC